MDAILDWLTVGIEGGTAAPIELLPALAGWIGLLIALFLLYEGYKDRAAAPLYLHGRALADARDSVKQMLVTLWAFCAVFLSDGGISTILCLRPQSQSADGRHAGLAISLILVGAELVVFVAVVYRLRVRLRIDERAEAS